MYLISTTDNVDRRYSLATDTRWGDEDCLTVKEAFERFSEAYGTPSLIKGNYIFCDDDSNAKTSSYRILTSFPDDYSYSDFAKAYPEFLI